jgi:flagellar biosynthesis GTPase FlhF
MPKVINQTSTDTIINALGKAVSAEGTIGSDNVSATLKIDCGEDGIMSMTLDQLDAAYRGIVKCWPGISPVKQQIILNARQAVSDAREAKKAEKEAEKLKARETADAARKAKEDAKEEARKAKEAAKAKRDEEALAKAEAKKKADMEKATLAATKLAEKQAKDNVTTGAVNPVKPAAPATRMEKNNAKPPITAKAKK